VYDRARLVISDRMHVLVLAALSGAVPLELVPEPTRKITAAFATIGLSDTTADASTLSADGMLDCMRHQLARREEVSDRVAAAAAELTTVETQVRDAIRAARA